VDKDQWVRLDPSSAVVPALSQQCSSLIGTDSSLEAKCKNYTDNGRDKHGSHVAEAGYPCLL
jgi:hypothetical protein